MNVDRPVALWLTIGAVGFLLVPWYAVDRGVWHFGWLATFAAPEHAPALWQAIAYGRWWLLPLGVLLAIAAFAARSRARTLRANALIAIGTLGLIGFFA